MVTLLEKLNRRLDENESPVRAWEMRYNGETPLTFLSPEAREALGNRLKALSVNYGRLAVDTLAGRLAVTGFRIDGEHSDALWDAWRSLGMEDGSAQVHIDALAVGRSAVTVWGDGQGPTASPEAPAQVTVERHPITREVVAALKRWTQDGRAYCVLYEPHSVSTYISAAGVPEGGVVPSTGWESTGVLPNPFGVVPVVPFVNRGRVTDVNGVSELRDIADLSDALVKVMTDSLVTSEHYARPRRYVTGLELKDDEDGNPIPPFPTKDGALKLWQSEEAETRFGQFPTSDLGGYAAHVRLLTEQIAALAGLPPSMVGLHSEQATSADAIRAAESQLVAKAVARQTTFGRAWGQVASLMWSAMTGADPRRVRAEVVWSDPSTRSEAANADAVAKLHAAGIVPTSEALARLGYSPERITELTRAAAAESALRLAVGA